MVKFLTVLTVLFMATVSYAQTYAVKHVIDSATMTIETGEEVRLIGISAPETVRRSRVAADLEEEALVFLKNMCEGRVVLLELDWEKRDQYNRLLVYVYLEDGTLLNAEMLKRGYARVNKKNPFKRMKEFQEYELKAMEQRRGLWKYDNSLPQRGVKGRLINRGQIRINSN